MTKHRKAMQLKTCMAFSLLLRLLEKELTILVKLRIFCNINFWYYLDNSFILRKVCLKANEPQIIKIIEENTKI